MSSRLAVVAALVAVSLAMVVLIAGSSGTSSPRREATKAGPSRSRHHFWLVRSGQTLSEIATRTGVSATTIRSLNQRQDLAILHAGERVRVRP